MYYCVLPKSFQPSGPWKDQIAKAADYRVSRTYFEPETLHGRSWVDYPSKIQRALFGGSINLKALRDECERQGLFEVKRGKGGGLCYSAGNGGFCPFSQAIRLRPEHKDSEFVRYDFERKPRGKPTGLYLGNAKLLPNSADWISSAEWLYQQLKFFSCDTQGERFEPWNQLAVERINAGDIRASVCEYGRYHTPYTTLARERRHCLRVDGSSALVQSDAKNCQPLILGAHFRKQSSANDILEWVDFCEDGLIYEVIVDVLNRLDIPSRNLKPWDRQAVKRPFLITLFIDAERVREQPVYRAMEYRFPTVAQLLLESKLKRGKTLTGKPMLGHQLLAQQCQYAEGSIFIRSAPKVIRQRYPELPLATIHDSWLVKAEHAAECESILSAEFKKQLGVKVKLDTQPIQRPKQVGIESATKYSSKHQ